MDTALFKFAIGGWCHGPCRGRKGWWRRRSATPPDIGCSHSLARLPLSSAHPTTGRTAVDTVRRELEGRSEFPNVDTITDIKGPQATRSTTAPSTGGIGQRHHGFSCCAQRPEQRRRCAGLRSAHVAGEIPRRWAEVGRVEITIGDHTSRPCDWNASVHYIWKIECGLADSGSGALSRAIKRALLSGMYMRKDALKRIGRRK